MARRLVLADWTATYNYPIELKSGDRVTLTGRNDLWDGHCWVWAIAPDGREGWIPDTLVDGGRTTQTYSAAELTCKTGDIVTVISRTHGWSWCVADDNRAGWVPDRCLGQPNTA